MKVIKIPKRIGPEFERFSKKMKQFNPYITEFGILDEFLRVQREKRMPKKEQKEFRFI